LTGQTLIQANVDDYLNNLDVELRLYNSIGTLLATHDPAGSFDGQLFLNLAAGTYYVEVRSDGDPGEAGQYNVVVYPPGSLPPPPGTGGPGSGGRNREFTFPADAYELNQTSDQATDFGTINGAQSLSPLSISDVNGLPDYDWYKWIAGRAGTFEAIITMNDGAFGDDKLEMHFFTLDGSTLVELDSVTLSENSVSRLTTVVTAGQEILVEVKGANLFLGIWGEGDYELDVDLL
jgi:hypothetical protein